MQHTLINVALERQEISSVFHTLLKKCKMVSVFTYAHVKWLYGQSERAYYLNYFIKVNKTQYQSVVKAGRERSTGVEKKRPIHHYKNSFIFSVKGNNEEEGITSHLDRANKGYNVAQ